MEGNRVDQGNEVKLFIGGHSFDDAGRRYFGGEWVKFDGELLETYEREEITYSLYKCTAYEFDAYRVYVADETNQMSPTYNLHPFVTWNEQRNYHEPYDAEQLADMYPMFAKSFVKFRERLIDPRRRS